MDKNKDIFGTAIKAYYEENDNTDIIVHSPDFEDDVIPIAYLFRNIEDMPEIEQKALELCQGKVLDVGCGAGSHALYLQKKKKLKVKAIDTSAGAIEIASRRGVENAVAEDFFKLKDQNFDTILMLMNGSGIIGKLKNLDSFFEHSRSLLADGGKILMDSSDLIYLFEDEFEDPENYFGEFNYSISYKDLQSEDFDWLFISPDLLSEYAESNGFDCEIIQQGDNYDFLASLTMKKN